MGIPRITEDCCLAVLEKAVQGTPQEFGSAFCTELAEEQPHLLRLMTTIVTDMADCESVEEAAEQAGSAFILVGFVWRAVKAQLEAQQMEED